MSYSQIIPASLPVTRLPEVDSGTKFIEQNFYYGALVIKISGEMMD
jgi:hypothetical protein